MSDVEKLLLLIKNRPAIYNFKLKEHSDKRIIDKLWLEIAKEMKNSTSECKSKYTSLRNSYARFLREQPPPGSVNKKKKTWYLAADISFLKDHMRVHRSTGSSIASTVGIKDESISSIASSVNELTDCDESIDYTPSSSASKRKKLTAVDKPAAPKADNLTPKLTTNEDEDPNFIFFKSMLPDIKKLSDQNQRKVKQDFLLNLNKLLDEQEKSAH